MVLPDLWSKLSRWQGHRQTTRTFACSWLHTLRYGLHVHAIWVPRNCRSAVASSLLQHASARWRSPARRILSHRSLSRLRRPAEVNSGCGGRYPQILIKVSEHALEARTNAPRKSSACAWSAGSYCILHAQYPAVARPPLVLVGNRGSLGGLLLGLGISKNCWAQGVHPVPLVGVSLGGVLSAGAVTLQRPQHIWSLPPSDFPPLCPLCPYMFRSFTKHVKATP